MSITDKVDIIVINCNNGDNLKYCINSIYNNTLGNFRIIVVDQNSKDGTREWLLDNVGHVILNNNRFSRSVAKNQALKIADTDWIAMIDPDSIIEDQMWLDKIWNYTIDRKIGFIEVELELKEGKVFSGLSFCLVRKQCLNEIGYFDQNLKRNCELDWYTRLEWSPWFTGYCHDIKIKNITGRGILGCKYISSFNFKEEMCTFIDKKYSMDFLSKTLIKNIMRRNHKLKELGVLDGSYRNNS